MPEKTSPQPRKDIRWTARPRPYRIKLRGQLDRAWVSAFNLLSFTNTGGLTIIEVLVDQAALRAILNRLWDLNQDVISAVAISGQGFPSGGE